MTETTELVLLGTVDEGPPYVVDVFLGEAPMGAYEDLGEHYDALLPYFQACCHKLFPILRDEHDILARLGLSSLPESWELDLTLVNNTAIRGVNARYRGKDEATDVLTFTLFAESPMRAALAQLPCIQLGSVFISLEWAWEHAVIKAPRDCSHLTSHGTDFPPPGFIHYVMERFVHGLLHAVGINHETTEAYNTVVGIQQRVLHEIFSTTL